MRVLGGLGRSSLPIGAGRARSDQHALARGRRLGAAPNRLPQRTAAHDPHSNPAAPSPGLHQTADSLQGRARVLHVSLQLILDRYWAASPTAARVRELLFSGPGGYGADQLFHDHLAFRTFGVPGLGIDGLGAALEAFGYTRKDDSVFEKKKLRATWYSPPPLTPGGPAPYRLLPRVFVSQLQVDQLSPAAQSVIGKYTARMSDFGPWGAWGAVLTGQLPWGPPEVGDYELLMGESEYAAWVLANGYSLNHTALAVHAIAPPVCGGLAAFNRRLEGLGFRLNGEGGLVKASADGLLLQASTVADSGVVAFKEAPRRAVQAYIEFVERRPLPRPHQHGIKGEGGARDGGNGALSGANVDEADEWKLQLDDAHRRDGFEAASADNIFASTTLAAAGGGGGGGGGSGGGAEGR